ncbi:MAG TPA: nuclear transport factor 2 family protein [Nitrosopumilaceae archaeon]|jgi:nuclear transport factor 2 (NTF2) superfamily protein|nr:nuclear transport factor 2 family protein [Nitrosopumilaceae archaeon]
MTVKPPFTRESAKQVVQNAQDAWNSQNSEKIAQGYTINSQWRNRTAFFTGRKAIIEFLNRKWEKELDYILKKEIWAFADNKISVRFEYEWRDADSCQWYRTHGNEHWEFDNDGLMKIRDMSANDIPILESQRRIWRKQ